MIIKSFEFNKIDHKNFQNFLFYGDNIALINDIIQNKFKLNFKDQSFNYEESEILKNEKNFFDEIMSQSFFENKKLIIISRSTDKIKKIAEEIIERQIKDLTIIYIADKLDKRSKLRNLFEKNKKLIAVPFYPDNQKTLSIIVNNFFNQLKAPISQELINIIVERTNNDRQKVYNELSKIENILKKKKNIKIDEILKLIKKSENDDISELVDFCLAKNQKKIIRIINENNFSSEDTVLIIRTFLNKTKRLIKLKNLLRENDNIDFAISNFKPTIFWKDKEIIKQQLKNWSDYNIELLLNSINENELLIKKNFENSTKILLNFIFSTVKIS